MKRGSVDVSFFLVDGQNISPSLTDFEDKLEAKTERSDGLGADLVMNAYVGVKDAEVSLNGFYEDSTDGWNNVGTSGFSSNAAVLSYCLEGTASNANAVCWQGAIQTNYNRIAQRDGLTKAKATYKINNGVIEKARVLWPYGAVAATGAKEARGLSATAYASGLPCYLQYNASAGEANVRIQTTSATGAAWSDVCVFTKISSGHGALRQLSSAALKEFVRVDFTTATATGAIGALNAFVGIVV